MYFIWGYLKQKCIICLNSREHSYSPIPFMIFLSESDSLLVYFYIVFKILEEDIIE